VADALAETIPWISAHTVAQIADAMPLLFVSNGLTTKAGYIAELAQDKGQCLAGGRMPAGGPQTVLAVDNRLEGFTK
jgi:NitT/TauT family transport system substrate-binding protein